MVEAEVPDFNEEKLNGKTVKEIIDTLQYYLEDSEYSDVWLELDAGYNNVSAYLRGKRLETDVEYKKRIEKQKKEKDIQRKSLEQKKANLIKEAKKLGLKVVE